MYGKNNILYLSEDTKRMILEAGALSGISQNIIKEIFEYMLIDFAIKITEASEAGVPAQLKIPYVGTLTVKYAGDEATPSGELDTKVDSSLDLAPAFRRLIGDINDQGYTELIPVLQKKIRQSVMFAASEDA